MTRSVAVVIRAESHTCGIADLLDRYSIIYVKMLAVSFAGRSGDRARGFEQQLSFRVEVQS